MKKILIVLVMLLGVCLVSVPVYAEEEQEQPVIEEENDSAEKWFAEFFSAEKVAMYISWVAYIGTIIGLVAKVKQLKQTNNLTLKNVSDEVKGLLQETIGDEVTKQFNNMLPSVLKTQEKTNQIMSIFAKILTLSQENTPESRVAILNLIEELGIVSKEIVDNSKDVIEQGKELAEKTKKQLNDRIDAIVERNEEETEVYDGTSI